MTKMPISFYWAFLFGAKLHHDDWLHGIGYDIDALDDVAGFERTKAARMILEQPGIDPDFRLKSGVASHAVIDE